MTIVNFVMQKSMLIIKIINDKLSVQTVEKYIIIFNFYNMQTVSDVDIFKQYTILLLKELITKYIELEWDMEFVTWFINSNWDYVTLQERTDSTWIDYSIRRTMLDSEYWDENEIDWWEIIFHFNDDYSYIDKDEIDMYKSDYDEYIHNKEDYIQDKLDYILQLTW